MLNLQLWFYRLLQLQLGRMGTLVRNIMPVALIDIWRNVSELFGVGRSLAWANHEAVPSCFYDRIRYKM